MNSPTNTVETSINLFGLSLLSSLRAARPDATAFVSPLSIYFAMAMVANGATDDTLREHVKTLKMCNIDLQSAKLPSVLQEYNKALQRLAQHLQSLENVSIKIANGVFVMDEHPVTESFSSIVKGTFNGEARNLNLKQGAADINAWVRDKTEGKIDKLVAKVEDDVALIIVNAIYFKGLFRHQFKEDSTKSQPFYLSNGQTKEVPLMFQSEKIPYYETEQFQAVNFPYDAHNLVATVVLPTQGTRPDQVLKSFEENTDAFSNNKFRIAKVDFSLPKFKIEWESSLKKVLVQLGMPRSFSNDAEFSEMSSHPIGVKIGDVLHKAFVEVNEKGTEAAAATAVKMMMRCAVVAPRLESVVMRVDRPFFFFIRDSASGLILFAGFIESV